MYTRCCLPSSLLNIFINAQQQWVKEKKEWLYVGCVRINWKPSITIVWGRGWENPKLLLLTLLHLNRGDASNWHSPGGKSWSCTKTLGSVEVFWKTEVLQTNEVFTVPPVKDYGFSQSCWMKVHFVNLGQKANTCIFVLTTVHDKFLANESVVKHLE